MELMEAKITKVSTNPGQDLIDLRFDLYKDGGVISSDIGVTGSKENIVRNIKTKAKEVYKDIVEGEKIKVGAIITIGG